MTAQAQKGKKNGETKKGKKKGKGSAKNRKKDASRPLTAKIVGTTPRVYRINRFASKKEVKHIAALADDAEFRERHGVETHRDAVTGFSFEMPIAGDTVLEAIRARMEQLLGFPNDVPDTFRFRRYARGESHPLHNDSYVIGGSTLVASALLYLNTTDEGGETSFPSALPEPITVAPKRGRLVVWFNHTPDGAVDPLAVHEALPVTKGSKATIAYFFYTSLENARRSIGE